ncbi:polyphosphate--glucose phosphotransferase [Mycobacteroides abscessus]|uniref:polyphosphate--glucose phosphotransferase n=1 Tax=Mycobacteroides abscessus TaxID=36809 RepID=UPI000241D63F|nr:ROK family protein [Mycobacteroides abscessus]SKS99723.1 polyphosphate-glucose phosphotransferase [Mycobacteroides abscessus subsp. abscessus]EHM18788.1 polyphosphate glucokinase PpgK [Mycobacteroides abscessus subsp. bolletii BD]MDO3125987.1 ROK family protein [Mycobacteroides abscessus subsp. bolletii]ORA29082.1 polyphosphate glucokinase [Mycobacteroides abscessus subsp. bolletii]TPF70290.1 polyphosphate glucokinase [Mycobacteroides abscessus subsp. bolletii]
MTATDSAPTVTAADPSPTARQAFGIDVGGSGIKGAIVDLTTGEMIGERVKYPTPQPATPKAVAETIARVVRDFSWTGPVGVTYPGVIVRGEARTAANVDKSWLGVNVHDIISTELGGQTVTVLNDADAAGLAEDRYGAGKDQSGVVVLLTFGTGIGSAVLHNGILLPNTEFGHIQVDGMEAEHRAASSVKEKNDWSYKQWAPEVTKVLEAVENALWPDLFIVGGGISRKADKWVPLLTNRTPVVAAALQNTAGIVGAAMAAHAGVSP